MCLAIPSKIVEIENNMGTEVLEDHARKVIIETRTGVHRVVDMPTGEKLSRIC